MQSPNVNGFAFCKAYIPLQRKTICVGYFCVILRKDTNMLVSFVLGDANSLESVNIGCVGSQTQNSCVGHVHFIFCV